MRETSVSVQIWCSNREEAVSEGTGLNRLYVRFKGV